MTLTIGLTGSIASGKSTVSLMFDEYGIPVVDADKVSREVVRPGEEAYDQIVKTFGSGILRADGTLDRPQLGSIVFNDEKAREKLNGIVHPAVRKKMKLDKEAYFEAGADCVVLDIPLLFEGNRTHTVDKTLVVYVDEEVQVKRLMERNQFTEEEAWQRISSQIPIGEKAKMADRVINNNGSKYESYEQLREILTEWKVI